MSEVQKYRRYSDGKSVDVIRYGNSRGRWDKGAITRITKFILGLDVDTRVTMANEQMLDVVRPDLERWNLPKGIADVDIIEGGRIFRLCLGDWVIRDEDGQLSYCRPFAFHQTFAILDEFDELADLIYYHFPWEGDSYKAIADVVASQLLKDGWTKKSKEKELESEL